MTLTRMLSVFAALALALAAPALAADVSYRDVSQERSAASTQEPATPAPAREAQAEADAKRLCHCAPGMHGSEHQKTRPAEPDRREFNDRG